MNFCQFLEDKKINEIIDNCGFESIKNRILIGKLRKKTNNSRKSKILSKKSLEAELSNTFISSKNIKSEPSGKSMLTSVIQGIKTSSTYHMFMISQKPLNHIDEEFATFDDEILDPSVLIEPYEFNKIYLFHYKGFGDNTPHKKMLKVEEIQNVQCHSHKKSFYLKVTMENYQEHLFTFQTSYQSSIWLKGLRTAIQTQEEVQRLNYGNLKYNIRILYNFYTNDKKTEMNEIINEISRELNPDDPVDQFYKSLEFTIKELNYFCDAIFAHKPFIQAVYEILIKTIHSSIRVRIMEFWNKNSTSFSAGEVLTFGNLVYTYEQTLLYWGVTDKKLESCHLPISQTFCNHIFKSSREVIYKVIEESLFLFKKHHDFYINSSIRVLEIHINICFENYEKFPTTEMIQVLIEMITMIIVIVQTNIIKQINTHRISIELEVLVSLINGNFEELIHNFIKKVHSKIKNQLNFKEIKQMIQYDYLTRNNFKIDEICMDILVDKISSEMEEVFDSQKSSFFNFNIKQFFKEFSLLYYDIILGMKDEIEQFDLVEKIILRFLEKYYEQFLKFSAFINETNIIKIINKIKNDKEHIYRSVQPLIGNQLNDMISIIENFENLLMTENPEKVRISILKITAFFKEEYLTEKTVQQLINTKIFYSDKQIINLTKEFQICLKKHKKIISEKKAIPNQIISIMPNLVKFKNILKEKIKEKDSYGTRIQTMNFIPSTTEFINNPFEIDDIFKFTTSCLMIKFSKKIEDLKIEKYLNLYISKGSKFSKVFIKLKKDALWISKDSIFKKIVEVIKYPYISCLNRLQNHSLYFKSQTFGYGLLFQEDKANQGQTLLKNLLLLKGKDNLFQKNFHLDLTNMLCTLYFLSDEQEFLFSYENFLKEVEMYPEKYPISQKRVPVDIGLNLQHLNLKI